MGKSAVECLCIGVLLSLPAPLSAQTFNVLRTFPGPASPFPFGRMVSYSNTLYGTSMGGGTGNNGAVFRIDTDGTGYGLLKSFSQTAADTNGVYTNSDGAQPLAGLALGGDTLYGTTLQGGTSGKGTVFSLKTDGRGFTVLKHFTGIDGKAPYAELVLRSNVLYGTTAGGGASGKGAVFRLNTDGTDFAVLKSFAVSDGLLPLGGLAVSESTLYGTTYEGGTGNHGTVFSIHTDGTDFVTLKEFSGADGSNPRFTLVLSGNSIYGTTEGDGDLSNSLVFKLNTDGTGFIVLKTFSPTDPISGTNSDGYYVRTGLASCGGTLYGTTRWGGYFGSGVVFSINTDGSGYSVIRHFSAATSNGGGGFINSDGVDPLPSLILSGGVLYGTTESGGLAGGGTLYRLGIAPRIQVDDGSFGIRPNGFGFNVAGYSNQTVIVEASTDIATSNWLPLQPITLDAGPFYFTDPYWTNYPGRFYRLRIP
jgi:uncharacterized repeat protein (TIGR03803 family)